MARIFATLGGVEFELPSVEELNDTIAWEYRQQETVAEKAVIQFAGAKARETTLKIHLSATFCKPEQRKKDLEAKARKIAPLPLILANGTVVGYFVIAEIATTLQKTDKDGNVIASELQLKLIEAEAGTDGGDGTANTLPSKPSAGRAAGAPVRVVPANLLPSGDGTEQIRGAMQQAQQQITGSVPSILDSLRRLLPF